jgi:hypothetical protein
MVTPALESEHGWPLPEDGGGLLREDAHQKAVCAGLVQDGIRPQRRLYLD